MYFSVTAFSSVKEPIKQLKVLNAGLCFVWDNDGGALHL